VRDRPLVPPEDGQQWRAEWHPRGDRTTGSGGPSAKSGLDRHRPTRPLSPAWLGRLKMCPYRADLGAGGCAHLDALACPQAVLEVAVALTARATRAFGPAVHPTPLPSPYCRLPPGRPARVLASQRGALTHGVVCHVWFVPSFFEVKLLRVLLRLIERRGRSIRLTAIAFTLAAFKDRAAAQSSP
jgi:hypothetical protein